MLGIYTGSKTRLYEILPTLGDLNMNHHLETYLSLKESDREKVIAAARWGDGPFTRLILKKHFPKLLHEEVLTLISDLRELTTEIGNDTSDRRDFS